MQPALFFHCAQQISLCALFFLLIHFCILLLLCVVEFFRRVFLCICGHAYVCVHRILAIDFFHLWTSLNAIALCVCRMPPYPQLRFVHFFLYGKGNKMKWKRESSPLTCWLFHHIQRVFIPMLFTFFFWLWHTHTHKIITHKVDNVFYERKRIVKKREQ